MARYTQVTNAQDWIARIQFYTSSTTTTTLVYNEFVTNIYPTDYNRYFKSEFFKTDAKAIIATSSPIQNIENFNTVLNELSNRKQKNDFLQTETIKIFLQKILTSDPATASSIKFSEIWEAMSDQSTYAASLITSIESFLFVYARLPDETKSAFLQDKNVVHVIIQGLSRQDNPRSLSDIDLPNLLKQLPDALRLGYAKTILKAPQNPSHTRVRSRPFARHFGYFGQQ